MEIRGVPTIRDLFSLSENMNGGKRKAVPKEHAKIRNVFLSFFSNISHYWDKRTFVNSQMNRLSFFVTIDEYLISPIGKRLFKKYLLRASNNNNDSEIIRFFECYIICEKFLSNSSFFVEEDELEDLRDLCPSQIWRHKLRMEFLNHESSNYRCMMLRALIEFRNECMLELEMSKHFQDFRKDLLCESKKIRALLRKIYNEIFVHTRDSTSQTS